MGGGRGRVHLRDCPNDLSVCQQGFRGAGSWQRGNVQVSLQVCPGESPTCTLPAHPSNLQAPRDVIGVHQYGHVLTANMPVQR